MAKDKQNLEDQLRDCERWVRFFESSLSYNPWDAYLDEKVRSIKRFKRKIGRLKRELAKIEGK